jgi:succinate dehydrogenase/fumarate reductase flavoprotein subunit
LFYSLKRNQVPVLFNAVATELVREAGRVVGAVVQADGRTQRIRTRKAVVLATGGYGHNAKLRKQFRVRPTPQYSVACKSNTGDGIELGLSNGGTAAPGRHGSGAFWAPVSVVRRADGSEGLFPHLSLDRAKPGLIAVNGAGRRFVDEGASYHDFVEAMYASHKDTPTIPAYLICEASFVARYGLGSIHPGTTKLARYERSGYLTTAPTLSGLATRLKLNPAALDATVKRHNEFARTGRDLEFGKGETELSRFNGDPSNKPNPCLREIENGPFVALAVWPAEIATSTGLQTDPDGRVLDGDDRPIGGLYACGNDMASVMSGTYPGPGTTLGPALTFGYRIAFHAAGKSTSSNR